MMFRSQEEQNFFMPWQYGCSRWVFVFVFPRHPYLVSNESFYVYYRGEELPKYKRDLMQKVKTLRTELSALRPTVSPFD